MKTPLPEPAIKEAKFGGYDAFTHAQLVSYGQAEYERGIEDAAQLCLDETEDVPLTVMADMISLLALPAPKNQFTPMP